MAPAPQPSSAEITIRVCSEIVRRLLEAHDKGETVNLNALKTQVASKYGSKSVPRLVDIISAVPQEVRDILLPKLRAKPVRTASGVRISLPPLLEFTAHYSCGR
jgi:elongator complex protein 3